MSEPGALCGPGQPDVSGPVLMPQTRYGLSVLKPALLVLLGGAGHCRLGLAPAEGWRGAARDRTRSPGRAKAKRVDCGAATNPGAAEMGLFQPLRLLGFFLGRKGTPFQPSSSDLHCRGQGPFPLGPGHSLEALEGRARPGSGWY